MRAIAAVVILAACLLRSRASSANPRDVTDIHRLLECARDIGPTKCISALASYRAENALNGIKHQKVDFDFAKDVENFQWKRFANKSDDEVYSQLCDGTERLLRYKALRFNVVPGYELSLLSKGNGTLKVDVFNRETGETARGMKKWRQKFYSIVPFLLLPGLFMSAVLPFILPALKMMTVAVGMINNMALTGAIFTLLRNNAFNDKYDKKVIYVNEGYHNEKHASSHDHFTDYEGHESRINSVSEIPGADIGIEEKPDDLEWIQEYYGQNLINVAKNNFRKDRVVVPGDDKNKYGNSS